MVLPPSFPTLLPAHLQYVLCEGVRQHVSLLQILVAERDFQQALPHAGEEVQGDGNVGS